MCLATQHDTFLFSVAVWAGLQLTWTIILLVAQTVQIARQMTTLEVSNLGRYGFMGGKAGASMTTQSNFMAQRAASGSHTAAAGEESHGEEGHHHHGVRDLACGLCNALLRVVGLDLYTRGKAGEGLKRASSASNPFSFGVVTNCRDFWTAGRELGVRYEELYEIPVEGFHPGQRSDDYGDAGRASASRWSMWAPFKRSSSSRGQYEAIAHQA